MRHVLRLGWLGLLGVALSACEPSLTSHLDGKWQLAQVERDGVFATVDTVWYNFQNRLFQYQVYCPSVDTLLFLNGFASLEGDRLSLELEATDRLSAFLPLTDWGQPWRSFVLVRHTTSSLVLKDGGITYTFRRY